MSNVSSVVDGNRTTVTMAGKGITQFAETFNCEARLVAWKQEPESVTLEIWAVPSADQRLPLVASTRYQLSLDTWNGSAIALFTQFNMYNMGQSVVIGEFNPEREIYVEQADLQEAMTRVVAFLGK